MTQTDDLTTSAIGILRQNGAIKLAWTLTDHDELASALRLMPSRGRNQMLSALRVPSAKVTTTTARLLISSLNRSPGERLKAARFITSHFAHEVTECLDDALTEGRDPVEALTAEAHEGAEGVGASIVALTAITYAYTEPDYHIPFLITCADAGLLRDELGPLTESLRALAPIFLEQLSARRPEEGADSSQVRTPSESVLRTSWEAARVAARQIQTTVREGRPVDDDDLAALRIFNNLLGEEAARVGLKEGISVKLVEDSENLNHSIVGLVDLQGPVEMSSAIDEVRVLALQASSDEAIRLAQFLSLVIDPSPLGRITRANELRALPEPPARSLLDAAIAGVLSVTPEPFVSDAAEIEDLERGSLAEVADIISDSAETSEMAERLEPEQGRKAPVKNAKRVPSDVAVSSDLIATASDIPETPKKTAVPPTVVQYDEEEATTSENDHELDLERASDVVAQLVRSARFDLAHHLAVAANWEYRAAILREAALAHGVRTPSSPAAIAMVDAASHPLIREDLGSVILRLASALRVALLDPGSGAPAILFGIAGLLDQYAAFRELALAVASPTSQMLSVAAVGEVLDAADAIAQAEAIAIWARDTKERPPHFPLHRGLELWQVWTDSTGPLGEILSLVASDDPEAVSIVREACRPYSTPDRIEACIDQEDRRLREGRPGHPQPLVGAGRRQLIRAFSEVIDQALAWCEARGRASGTDWSFEQREQLAVTIDQLKPLVLETLGSLRGDVWLEAARDAARDSISATIGLFRREALTGDELDVESALNRGLAFVIEVPLEEDGEPSRPPTLSELLEAASRSPRDAFEARLSAEQFGAAEILLDTLDGSIDDFDAESARVRLAASERDSRSRVTAEYNALYDSFAAARARGRIGETSAPALHSQLLAARPDGPDTIQRRDLGALRTELTSIAGVLVVAIEERREQVRSDVETALGDGRISSEWGSRLRGLLEREELGAAEEYLYRAQVGNEPPEERHDDSDATLLSQTLVALASSGLDEALVVAVRSGNTERDLDFSGVPEIDRDSVAAALSAWVSLHTPDGRPRWRDLLPSVLRLLGIVTTNIETPAALGPLSAPGRFFVDAVGDRSGRAFVPSFGSRAQSRRRMMLTFEPMPAGQLWDTAASGAMPDQPVYVLYVGTLSAEGRLALGREARVRGTGQVVVIDDAVILACALAGRQAYDVTMRAVLPYAAANPYNPDLPGEIPEEMFYGRQSERDNIANLTGASFVSGGRRFGKTALLHSVRKIYDRPQSNVIALFVVIQHVAADPQQSAADLWPLLARRLMERGVLEPSTTPDAEAVCASLRGWLSEQADRRLLLLLDECDLFLRADAEGGFRNVAELRNLMAEFGGRFKVVFSGLQHVARYLKLPNQPLSQLPPPVVIGPLDPSAACGLARRPLEALGFSPTDAQIDRLVTYCACNPSVIQLAGMQLVERLREQPITELAPWPIDDRLLNRLLDSDELATGVRNRLFLTLNLDHRYKLLAYLVAFRALSDGLGTVASPSELRTLAFEYWPDGFSSQRPDDVRALCDELVGLGVFAGDADNGYRMLSPAAVRLFGTTDEIEGELTNAFETYVPDMAVGAAGSRPRIEGDRYSPLSASQLADVVGQGKTQLRVVIGSRALCAGDVVSALRIAADALPNVSVTKVERRRDWLDLMTAPANGHRVVVADGTTISRTSFEESIDGARRRGATRSGRGTRSAVLVVGPHDRQVLRRLVVTPGSSWQGDLADVGVALGRVDLDSLRAWARIEELDVVLPTQLSRLLEVTGGWPKLIERLLFATRSRSFDAAADEMEAHLTSLDGARGLLADIGLDAADSLQPANPGLVAVLRALVRHDLEGDPETLATLMADDVQDVESDPAEALAILQILGALETGDNGDVAVQSLVRQCLVIVDSELSAPVQSTEKPDA
jgi:hypothetical protein